MWLMLMNTSKKVPSSLFLSVIVVVLSFCGCNLVSSFTMTVQKKNNNNAHNSHDCERRKMTFQHPMSKNDEEVELRLGVLADIQYAPVEDGFSYGGTPRYYRHALDATSEACLEFRKGSSVVDAILNLGDSLDGKCIDHDSMECLQRVLSTLSSANSPIYHTYGNHEMYNIDRSTLLSQIIPTATTATPEEVEEDVGYYTIMLNQDWRLIVMDTYDISLFHSKKKHLADEILTKHNPNYPEKENSPEGLKGKSRRFVAFGGGVDEPQIQWLTNLLQQSRANKQKVLLMSHQPLHPNSSPPVCLVWNYPQILELLEEYSDVVAMHLSGHAHMGGYFRSEKGIHYRVMEAVLESPPPISTFGILNITQSNLHLQGYGDCKSGTYSLDHLSSTADDDNNKVIQEVDCDELFNNTAVSVITS